MFCIIINQVVFIKIFWFPSQNALKQFWWWAWESSRVAVERADYGHSWRLFFVKRKKVDVYLRGSLAPYSDKSPTLPVSWEPLWLGECLVCEKERELMTNGDNYTNLSDPPVLRGCSTERNITEIPDCRMPLYQINWWQLDYIVALSQTEGNFGLSFNLVN